MVSVVFPVCSLPTIPMPSYCCASSVIIRAVLVIQSGVVQGRESALLPTFAFLLIPLPLDAGSRGPGHVRVRGTGAKHPVLHGKPLAPARLGSLDFGEGYVLERAKEGDGLAVVHVVVGLDGEPCIGFGSKEVVAALCFVDGADATGPVVAKEAVEDSRRIEGGGNEATDVGNEDDDVGICGRVGDWRLIGACSRGILGFLVGEFNVDKGGNGLDRATVLGVIEKVA